jgi:hypothetical protein
VYVVRLQARPLEGGPGGVQTASRKTVLAR